MNRKYDDIINLPHPTSTRHPRMSRADRAAQFSPFAALTGLGAALQESARLTDNRIVLDEYEQAELDKKLRYLRENLPRQPYAAITYFVPDERKEGGHYTRIEGRVKKLLEYEKMLVLMDGTSIALADILAVETKQDGD